MGEESMEVTITNQTDRDLTFEIRASTKVKVKKKSSEKVSDVLLGEIIVSA